MRLDARIPDLAGPLLARAVERLLVPEGLRPDAVSRWALHPGGKRVLEKAIPAGGLPDAAREPAASIYREFGNMSSPTVLFVLVLRRLPDRFESRTAPWRRGLRVLVATAVGLTVFGLAILTGDITPETPASDEMIDKALPEGEGRNAVFLAGRGHAVTAVDQSEAGLAKAHALAETRSVPLTTVAADLAEFKIAPQAWAGVVAIFMHLPPALRRTVLQEGSLQRRQRAIGKTLHRTHRATFHRSGRHEAGAGRLAVEQHRAGAAVAGVAADLGAGQAEFVAQNG